MTRQMPCDARPHDIGVEGLGDVLDSSERGLGRRRQGPLVFEYEMALKSRTELSHEDAEGIVDYLCHVADRRRIYFLWRPFLRDPGDEMVLEVAVEAEADDIVTHNLRDFSGVEDQFGIRVITPGAFLTQLEAKEI